MHGDPELQIRVRVVMWIFRGAQRVAWAVGDEKAAQVTLQREAMLMTELESAALAVDARRDHELAGHPIELRTVTRSQKSWRVPDPLRPLLEKSPQERSRRYKGELGF